MDEAHRLDPPEAAGHEAPISSTFVPVSTSTSSFCRPSRGPTSTISMLGAVTLALRGFSGHHNRCSGAYTPPEIALGGPPDAVASQRHPGGRDGPVAGRSFLRPVARGLRRRSHQDRGAHPGDPMRLWGRERPYGRSLWFPVIARNKKSVTLNLRTEAGQQVARDLIARSDVVVENFRPGTLERWNLGYDRLAEANPDRPDPRHGVRPDRTRLPEGRLRRHRRGHGRTPLHNRRSRDPRPAGWGSASGTPSPERSALSGEWWLSTTAGGPGAAKWWTRPSTRRSSPTWSR